MANTLPQRYGKYVLLRRIAVGGMAEIFKAKVDGAEGFEKELVIKRILPHFNEDEDFVRMFVDEARITAKLQHPNIVQIFDFDIVDGTYYIAMEYIEGKDLKDVIERVIVDKDHLSVYQCVWIAIEVAKGLHYAHTKEEKGKPLNIVHRDVTPSNVMISFRGDVKLMDFGIAKAAQRSTKTQAGAVKGKVAYMSPEQARGKQIDARTDVFALGVMLWEILTERRLFSAESDFDTLTNVLKMDAPPPSSINASVPKDLDPIIAKLLEKDVDKRYVSAEVVARELTRWFYSHVVDIEKEKLKPLMYRLFKDELDHLEALAEEERAAELGVAPSTSSEATAQAQARSRLSRPSRDSWRDEATQMVDRRAVIEAAERNDATATAIGAAAAERARGAPPPVEPDDDKTTVDRRAVSTGTLKRPKRGPPPAGPTGNEATATAQESFEAPTPPRRRGPRLWLVALLLALGGGIAALIVVLAGNSGPGPGPGRATAAATSAAATSAPPTSAPETSAPATTPATRTAEADAGSVAAADADNVDSGKIEADAVAQVDAASGETEGAAAADTVAPAAKHTFAIEPSAPGDEVWVGEKRLGLGAQAYEGVIGDVLTIKIVPAGGGKPILKVVTVATDLTVFKIATPVELLVTLDPAVEATVKASLGQVEVKAAGQIRVFDLAPGAPVDLDIAANGFKPVRRTLTPSQASEAVTIKLEKNGGTPPIGPTPGAKGTLQIAARPWAQVTVNGRPYGTTPQTVRNLAPGTYTVVLTKGGKSVTRRVAVVGGKQAQVFVDLTE